MRLFLKYVFACLLLNLFLAIYFYIKKFSKLNPDVLNEAKFKVTYVTPTKYDFVVSLLRGHLEVGDTFTNKSLYDELALIDPTFVDNISMTNFGSFTTRLLNENYLTLADTKQGKSKVYTYINPLPSNEGDTTPDNMLGYCNFLNKNPDCLNVKNPKKIQLTKFIEEIPSSIGTNSFVDKVVRYLCADCHKKFSN